MASPKARLAVAAVGLVFLGGVAALLTPAPRPERPLVAAPVVVSAPLPLAALPPVPQPPQRLQQQPAPAPAPTPTPERGYSAAPELETRPKGELAAFDPNTPSAARAAAGECLISHRWGVNSQGRGARLTVTVDGKPFSRHTFDSAQLAAGTVTWVRIPDDTRDHTVVFESAFDHHTGVTSTGRSTFVGRGIGTWRVMGPRRPGDLD